MNYAKILNSKVERLFSAEGDRERIFETLNQYGIERHEQEAERVRLAVLKISGNDPEEVRTYIRLAKDDFRDILAWAEYPRQSKVWSMPDGPGKQKLIEADRRDYEEWANT